MHKVNWGSIVLKFVGVLIVKNQIICLSSVETKSLHASTAAA